MIPWQLIDRACVPESAGELSLHRRGSELSIRIDGRELMNSRMHGSEDALAELTCAQLGPLDQLGQRARPAAPRVLIGGLGMGFTLAAALTRLPQDAEVVLAELVPAVVAWNRAHLAHLAGAPLDDARVVVREADVARVMGEQAGAYDAILLDVDNGPEGLTRKSNDWLYGRAGLRAAHAALRDHGVLGVWSVQDDSAFTKRLDLAGFEVQEHRVHPRGADHGCSTRRRAARNKGSRHTIWVAIRSKAR